MTAQNASLDQNRGSASRQQTLTLVFALLTLVLALFSTIGSSRLHTLALNDQAANRAATVANTAQFQVVTASLQARTEELEAAEQARDAALKEAKRLRQQHAAVVKALDASVADLARANQAITELETALPVESPIPPMSPIPDASAFDGEGSAADELMLHGFTDTRRTVQ